MNEILEAVVAHLGGNVTISIEVEGSAQASGGYDERTQRTVSENATQLSATQQGFED